MKSNTVRSVCDWDPQWIRVEFLDDDGRPLGYTEFEPARPESIPFVRGEHHHVASSISKRSGYSPRRIYRLLHQLARTFNKRLPSWRLGRLASFLGA